MGQTLRQASRPLLRPAVRPLMPRSRCRYRPPSGRACLRAMTRTLLLAGLLVASAGSLSLPFAAQLVGQASKVQAWTPRPELLVSTAWLAAHGTQAGLRIVDVRDPQDFAAGHIPGAVNFPADLLLVTVNGVDGLLPPPAALAQQLAAVGIGADTTVVSYDDAGGLYAARLFWVLDYLGQGRGRLLDGGWPRWLAQGRAVSRAAVAPVPALLTAKPQPDRMADLTWMLGHLGQPGIVYVDARSTWEYRGATRYAKHRGHIPGAVHFEWRRHLQEDGTLRPAEALRAEYEALGVTPEQAVAVYCQVNVRSSHSYFVLRWLGHSQVRGYDGSWEEWGNREDTPKALF